MVTNPYTIDFSPYSPRQDIAAPTFRETVSATLGYTYDPIMESIRARNRFGRERQEGYDPFDDLGDHALFAMDLRHATSPAHMAFLKRGIDESIQRRQVLANSSFTSQLFAGLFDPLNLVALPLGGPAVGIGRSVLRVGLGSAVIQAGVEAALIQPYDPVQSQTESMYNIAGAAMFGGAFGGVASIPITRRASALAKMRDDLVDYQKSLRQIEHISELSANDLNDLPNAVRPHESLSVEQLKSKITNLTKKQEQIELTLATKDKEDFSPVTEERDIVATELSAYRREAGIRELLDQGYTPEKLWSINKNAFTDSIFYRAVSTPFKRVLQSDTATGLMKEAMVRLGGDSGVNLMANVLGFASPLSVHQRAAVRNGEWVRANDQLIKLFREEMKLANVSVMDIDVVQAYRSVMRRDDSYGSWLRGINQKRTTKVEKLTEVEKRAIGVIDDFFKKAERELQDVGLIGSKKAIKDKLNYLNRALANIEDEIGITPQGRLLTRLESRRNNLIARRDEAQASLDNFADTDQVSIDSFLPRFWNHKAIEKDRRRFEDILRNWYFKNPTIWVLEKGKWTKKYLGTDKDAIDKRVKDTIDNILNETDPTNEASIGYGYGRSKHFRHRKLDIPNELVWDFIMQDPLAIMKTYTARIAPRLEFTKQFGNKELDDVVFDLERDMIKKGVKDKEIRKHMRDFNLMYDRIAGAVLRNPSALSQKAAYVMKEAAATNYMGSGFVAAVPEFGRIVMEHDGAVMIKAIQGLLDKDIRMKGSTEIRLSGEAIDILKGSAFARMVDDMANNVDATEFWNKARNAFYTLNGLGPITQLSKTLDGIARGHTIIERSIKLSRNEASAFEREWLARYGIDQNMAKQIARAPWQQSQNGLYLANTDEWSTSFLIPEIEGKTVKIVEANEDGTPVGIMREGVGYVPARYNWATNTIFFDRDYIEGEFFESKAWLNPRREGIKPLPDVFDSPKDWSNFVMLHEIMHTRFRPEDLGIYAEQTLKKEFTIDVETVADAEAPNVFTFSRVYTSPKKLLKELEYINLEIANQNEIITALMRSDAPPDDELLASFANNSAIRDELTKISKTEEFKQQLDIEKGLSPHLRLSQRQFLEYENKINDLAFAEYKKQNAIQQETVDTFRSALNSGILNTILAATPADRPIINDGVVFVPHHIAKRFGYKEDPKAKGYSRIENGFLALPFQFYSYTLANVNKMVGAAAHGQLKNRAVGLTTMLGLGYLSVKMRYSLSGAEFAWDEMSAQDRFARAWDSSGVTALYSDLFYQSMHTSLALGGPNITNGFLQPKFPQKESAVDAITNVAGAGPSIATDLFMGGYEFASGNYGEGAKQVVRNLPFARMWFWKDDMNAITRMWAQ